MAATRKGQSEGTALENAFKSPRLILKISFLGKQSFIALIGFHPRYPLNIVLTRRTTTKTPPFAFLDSGFHKEARVITDNATSFCQLKIKESFHIEQLEPETSFGGGSVVMNNK